ncbi:unnamed protein product [Echinostoma caproni]|uniref:CCDC50_N domain-containing protein n=1 Tax=Echinostoma caproni TaxID=27848 RepID=A0A183BC41_9TREM|nr:unnamed protein product [Echinostoma caproni]
MLSQAEKRCLRDITDGSCSRDGVIANQGEVYADYLKQMEKESRLRAVEEKKNEEASLALALQLLKEDSFTEDEVPINRIGSAETAKHNVSSLSPVTQASGSQVSAYLCR